MMPNRVYDASTVSTALQVKAPTNLAPHPTFDGPPDDHGIPAGWYVAAPRDALKPIFALDTHVTRSASVSATARGGGNSHCFGKWGQLIPVQPSKHYEVSVTFRAENLEDLNVNLLIALIWQLPGNSNRNSPSDHLSHFEPLEDGWLRASGTFQAPPTCHTLDLELYLRFAPEGTVWWDSISVQEVPAPAPRVVNLAAVRWNPPSPTTLERNLAEVSELLDRAGRMGADLVCLPELINKAGMPDARYEDVAEPLEGPTYQLVAAKARQYSMHALGCIYERDGDFIFNTAFLLDRTGALTGIYRKVHLYWPEEREGVSPGDDFPVFDTDLGRLGVITCYDSWFPESSRILSLKGVEVILFPSAGYSEEQVLARPGDNGAYMVASALNSPALIATPDCRILARTTVNGVVMATIDLNDKRTSHQNAGGTLNASPGGKRASRHAPSLRLYQEILAQAANPFATPSRQQFTDALGTFGMAMTREDLLEQRRREAEDHLP